MTDGMAPGTGPGDDPFRSGSSLAGLPQAQAQLREIRLRTHASHEFRNRRRTGEARGGIEQLPGEIADAAHPRRRPAQPPAVPQKQVDTREAPLGCLADGGNAMIHLAADTRQQGSDIRP